MRQSCSVAKSRVVTVADAAPLVARVNTIKDHITYPFPLLIFPAPELNASKRSTQSGACEVMPSLTSLWVRSGLAGCRGRYTSKPFRRRGSKVSRPAVGRTGGPGFAFHAKPESGMDHCVAVKR